MPKKPQGRDKPRDFASSRRVPGSRIYPEATQPSDSAMLAVSVHIPPAANPTPHTTRPTLPPLSYLQGGSQFPNSPSSASSKLYSGSGSHVSPSQYSSPAAAQNLSIFSHGVATPSSLPVQGSETDYYGHPSGIEHGHFHAPGGPPFNPLKGPHAIPAPGVQRSWYGAVPHSVEDDSMKEYRGYPRSRSTSNTSTPTTTSHPNLERAATFSASRSISSTTRPRFRLHIRQQPRAARAGPDGKDRRPIDPPPVLQLMMTDFNIKDDSEIEELQSRYWVAHCRLVSANSPLRDMSTLASTAQDGSKEIQRLLLGTSVASPFPTKDDPDPGTMPLHPITAESEPPTPPSPSSRFLPSSHSTRPSPPQPRAGSTIQTPATFFIFADLSVRKAGEYRLEFSLMHMDPESLSQPGYNVPILCTITSQVFKVVNAKDFDQVKASTSLVRGLVDRGAGFPLKLKKGARGEGRAGGRMEGQSQGDEDSNSYDEED